MRIMIIFIILSSCSYYDSKKIKKNEIVIDKNISFNDFKKKILIYGKTSSYPNINE